VQLSEKHHAVKGYLKTLRRRFAEEMPEVEVFFLAPDITTQVLNFGLSAPIDVQVVGPIVNNAKDYAIAQKLQHAIAAIAGAVDLHLAQVVGHPELRVDVDRTEASQSGVTRRTWPTTPSSRSARAARWHRTSGSIPRRASLPRRRAGA
jgi:Cu/Ag efflux pump CusA